jgi:pimeloyl-ACP methyl ester carboxylesterase
LVLVDPSFAGQNAWVASPKAIHNDEQEYRDEIGQLTQCITVTSAAPIGENNPRCPWSFSPQRTAVQKAYLGYAFGHPFKWAEERSELEMFHANGPELSEDGRQEERARRPFAQMPVIVLTAGKSPPLEAGQTPDELATEEEIWRKGHDALAARSLQGKSILVPEASHFIQIDRPDAVIAAIQEVVAKVRAKSAD